MKVSDTIEPRRELLLPGAPKPRSLTSDQAANATSLWILSLANALTSLSFSATNSFFAFIFIGSITETAPNESYAFQPMSNLFTPINLGGSVGLRPRVHSTYYSQRLSL